MFTHAGSPSVDDVRTVLGLRGEVRTPADLDRAIRAGLPFRSIRTVERHFMRTSRSYVRQIVASRSTLDRREVEGKFRPDEGERLARIAHLAALAEHVWESKEEAQRFLLTPHPQLEGQTPLAMTTSDIGASRVEAVLRKLEYSLPV